MPSSALVGALHLLASRIVARPSREDRSRTFSNARRRATRPHARQDIGRLPGRRGRHGACSAHGAGHRACSAATGSEGNIMLWTIVLAVPALWTVDLVSSTTLGGLSPYLLVAAVSSMLGHAISLQHRPRGLRRPSRPGRERELARKDVLPMAKSPGRSVTSRILGGADVRVAALSLLAVALG